jgi:peroxin-3
VAFDNSLRRQITQDDSDGGVGALGSPADTGTTEPTPASTPADSLLLVHEGHEHDEATGYATDGGTAERSARRAPAPGTLAESLASVASESTDVTEVTLPAESWASEFTRGSDDELLTSSTISQAISLPPTDTSSVVPSPQSQLSTLEASPPQRLNEPAPSPPQDPRSKKQLWRDLKVQSESRGPALLARR